MAGESLGSFGGETAFSGEYSLANLTDGALFAGPPNFNTLFREFSDYRDPGSPEVQPVYQDGRIVRFANDPTTANTPERPALGGQPGPVPDAPVRPDRLVESASDLQRA